MGIWQGPPHSEIPRCGAYAKGKGAPCMQYAMKNGRCRWHGGKSTGAKKPHRPIKHGRYTRNALQQKQELVELLRVAKRFAGSI